MIGYSEKRSTLIPFRVDRTAVPHITEEAAVKNTEFNPVDFTNKVVQMYSSGSEETVSLRCKNEMMRSVIDKFGEKIRTEIIDDKTFTAAVQVRPSNTFFAWVFTFAGDIEIMEPKAVREEYLERARKAAGIEGEN